MSNQTTNDPQAPYGERPKQEPIDWSAVVHYDPCTGSMTWKTRPSQMFKSVRSAHSWNTRYSGKAAGNRRKDGYVQVGFLGRMWLAHRIAFAIMKVETPDGMEVDHVNRVRHDNRWGNLRLATVAMNQWNTDKQVNNTSGFKGVSWHSAYCKWEASMCVNGKKKWVGRYTSKEDAIAAYESASIQAHGAFHVSMNNLH